MKDALPSSPWFNERIIVNLDNTSNRGTHWVAVRKDGNSALYFDSFGNLQPPYEIVRYLGSGTKIHFNSNRYQDFDSVLCGHLCLWFLSL